MTLESQVVSLSLAKKLKELGAEQESIYFWRVPNDTKREKNAGAYLMRADQNIAETKFFDYYAAFTVAELEYMLIGDGELIVSHFSGEWQVQVVGKGQVYSSLPADSRAKMLIYLLENKLLSTPSMKVD